MLSDKFGRIHNYLRISLTERCNLRCFYCMPPEGITLSPREHIMRSHEIEKIAQTFVKLGVNKIRLTGGEPLIRKDFEDILERLAKLGVTLAITTNGILLDQFLPLLHKKNVSKFNISLDTLKKEKFNTITRRDYFEKVTNNINALLEYGIKPKINVVLIKGVNDDEIIDFISLTKDKNLIVQFIEFMPFLGNSWDNSKCVAKAEVLTTAEKEFGANNLFSVEGGKNDTAKYFKIKNFKSEFGIISTITNPFCDTCNRIRLTANGRIKNCLFSQTETDLLTPLREGLPIEKLITNNLLQKNKGRNGIDDFSTIDGKINTTKNRSMILIGG